MIAAARDPMLRWLWGRAGSDGGMGRWAGIRLTGDRAWAGYLRRMLAAATQ